MRGGCRRKRDWTPAPIARWTVVAGKIRSQASEPADLGELRAEFARVVNESSPLPGRARFGSSDIDYRLK